MPEQREIFPISLDEVDDILAGDDAARLAELRGLLKDMQGMSDADIDRAIDARKLRRAVHAADGAALSRRLADGPEPTDEEKAMRAFAENLESPVREAVLTLRRKGYDTLSSGFSDFDRQRLSFSGSALADLPIEAREALHALGVSIDVDGTGLTFRPETIGTESIREMWNRIAEILPDRGTPAPARQDRGTAQFNQWERNRSG